MTKSDLIQAVRAQKSLSIVGMAKNTGKTTCLNFILEHLFLDHSIRLGLTSIGVDGEAEDVLYNTPKPRIILPEGTIFLTSERHFEERELDAEVLEVNERETALGRLITAKVVRSGKIILSGPSDTLWLKSEMNKVKSKYNTDLFIVDGALSRLSLASPAVTDSLILTTGAAVSKHLPELIRKVKHLTRLIDLPLYEGDIYEEQKVSVFSVVNPAELLNESKPVFVQGVLSDRFLSQLSASDKIKDSLVVVQDFTRCFMSPAVLDKYLRRGGRISVLNKANLLGICTNPTSPEGYCFDPYILRDSIQNEVDCLVLDLYLN